MTAEVKQSGRLADNLKALHGRLAKRLVPALEAAAKELLDQSLKLVPRDTHALAESGHSYAIGSGLQTQYIVAYGSVDQVFEERLSSHGPTAGLLVRRYPHSYALFVHWDMETRHDPGQSALFLYNPYMDKRAEIVSAFNQRL